MDVGEWERLDYAERDAALLQAAVVEGAKGKYPTSRLDETTSIRQLGLPDADLVNCEVSERGTLVAHEGASVTFLSLLVPIRRGSTCFRSLRNPSRARGSP